MPDLCNRMVGVAMQMLIVHSKIKKINLFTSPFFLNLLQAGYQFSLKIRHKPIASYTACARHTEKFN